MLRSGIRVLVATLAGLLLITGAAEAGAPSSYKPGFGYTKTGPSAYVNLNQTDPGIANRKFCKRYQKPMKGTACGVVALSMVGQTLTGNPRYTPWYFANKYCNDLIKLTPTGPKLSYRWDGKDMILEAIEDMGLLGTYLGRDLGKAQPHLKDGAMVVILFNGSVPRFTGGGHYLVGYATSGGKIWLADPYGTGQFGHNNEARPFSISYLKSHGLDRAWLAEVI